MKRFRIVLTIGVLITLLSSCAMKQPFTNQIIEKYDLSEKSFRQVQFYTSGFIVLEADNVSSAQSIEGGKIVVSENNKSHKIVIQPQTKCVFEKMGENGEIYVRFEQGTYKFLKFQVRRNDASGRYYLSANFDNSKNQMGKVVYNNLPYYVTSSSANSFLLISIKKLNKTYGKTEVVKGMKVY